MKLRVIIGAGTAAQIYRSLIDTDPDWMTMVIGDDGLWAGVRRGVASGHKMGQPPHLLQMPGQPVPGFRNADGTTPDGLQGFLDADNFQATVDALAQQNQTRDQAMNTGAKCTGIRREDRMFLVQTTWRTIRADQVIIAAGIGPQRAPPRITNPLGASMGLGFKQVTEGIEFLCGRNPTGADVFIYGGGATAAWVADHAFQHARHVTWAARLGGGGFDTSVLPGNRNAMILAQPGLRIRATVDQLTYLLPGALNGLVTRPMVGVEVTTDAGVKETRLCDQFIYSLGGDSAAPGNIASLLGPVLSATLAPLRDHDRVLSDGNGVLCWATPDRRLMVVGAAAFNLATQNFGKQEAPMDSLPKNAQVPDGIAVITATISALTNHIPAQQEPGTGRVLQNLVNLNIGDKNQVAIWVALTYPDLPASAANRAVELILWHRSQRDYGLTDRMVAKLVSVAARAA